MQEPTKADRKIAYSSSEFQQACNVGNTKMHEEINAGRLKARLLGRKLIITHDDAMAWLASLPERSASKQEAA